MIEPILGPLVPYEQAEPNTRTDFLKGLLRLYGLEGNPGAWRCTVCGHTTAGNDILITYNVPTPIQVCPTKTCGGYGPQLGPAPAA